MTYKGERDNKVRLYGNTAKDGSGTWYTVLLDSLGRMIVNTDASGDVTSATNTKVSVGSSSTTVLALNADRISAVLVNDSDEEIYISLSGTAVMNEGIRLNANGGSLIESEYTGIITAICASGTKNLTVVEK